MHPMLLVAAFLFSLTATVILVPMVRWTAVRFGWVDVPDRERKLHSRPTPNIGGLAITSGVGIGLSLVILLGSYFGVTISPPGILVLVGAFIIVLTGFYDDVRNIGFRRKFVVQLVVAYLLIFAGYEIDVARLFFEEGSSYSHALINVPITLIWIVGVINAINLLDGLDGLISGIAVIAFASLAIVFSINGQDPGLLLIASLMIGALFGFLFFNFQPASIFMGDSGSMFLGYVLALFTLQGTASENSLLAILIPFTVLGLPILDTSLCMVRRLLEGRSPFSPDDDHIHHRLTRLLSHRRAVLALYAIAVWFAIAAILMSISTAVGGVLIALITLSAAYVGIRTLGYLDINLSKLLPKRSSSTNAVSTNREPELSLDKLSLRQHHVHYDVVYDNRTLPVGFAETRGPWRRDTSLFDENSGDGGPPEGWLDANPSPGSIMIGPSRHDGDDLGSKSSTRSGGKKSGHSDRSVN